MKRRAFLLGSASAGLSACSGATSLSDLDLFDAGLAKAVNFAEVNAFAARANAAYGTEAEIKAQFPNTVRINIPEGSQTRYFLEQDSSAKLQWISVRGTENWTDVMHDVETHVEEHNTIPIPLHKGFRDLAQLIYADVKPHLNPRYTTNLTGHSLGAAIAAILMLYLERDGFEVGKVINFGQPKFTTTAGQNHYKDLPLQRIVDKNDIVPMLPPSGLGLSKHGPYVHIGTETILLDGSQYVFLDVHDSGRLSVGEFWRNRKYASLNDHHVSNYMTRIAAKLRKSEPVKYAEWVLTQAPS